MSKPMSSMRDGYWFIWIFAMDQSMRALKQDVRWGWLAHSIWWLKLEHGGDAYKSSFGCGSQSWALNTTHSLGSPMAAPQTLTNMHAHTHSQIHIRAGKHWSTYMPCHMYSTHTSSTVGSKLCTLMYLFIDLIERLQRKKIILAGTNLPLYSICYHGLCYN